MSFPEDSFRGRALSRLTIGDSHFQPSSLAGTRLSNCLFRNCRFERLEIYADTLYYHEYRLRLPHGHGAGTELRLHAARDFAYAVIIGSLGFLTWNGSLAWVLCALLLAEIGITLWDFVEEDRIRRLPGGERAMHAVMGMVYGAFLTYLVPEILRWSTEPTGFGSSYHGFPAWLLTGLAVGVLSSGVRDVMASVRLARQ